MTILSLCMIVKNEAATLPQCLDSVKDLIEEMVVLDTGSHDNTVSLAQDLGAKVYHYQWHDDFAAARNQALQYVESEWVLVLDADEVLVPEVIPHIQQAIKQEDNLVVNLLRHEIGASSSPYSQVSRLFRNHPQVRFSRPYHAIIDDAVSQLLKQEPHWQIVSLPQIGIKHYGYQPDMLLAKDKTNRAQQAMEAYWGEHPQDAYVCSKLGALYVQIGQVKQGIKLFKQGLKSNQADAPLLFELHYHLANALVKTEKLDAAVKHYQKAITQPILDKLKLGAYHNLASLCQSLGDFQNAIKLYETTLKIDPNFALGYYNLGLSYKAMGKYLQAINVYKQAINLNPEYPWTYQNLGVVFLKVGQIEASLDAFKKAIALHQNQNPDAAESLKQELKEMGIIVD